MEKAKAAIIQNQLAMTRGISFRKGQPCLTSSDFQLRFSKVRVVRMRALFGNKL